MSDELLKEETDGIENVVVDTELADVVAADDILADIEVAVEAPLKSRKLREAERILGEDRVSGDGPELHEKVVHINRCAKVVKGGRRFSFSALVVCGDKSGRVGFGFGKANEVSDCIRKASDASRRDLMTIKMDGGSIPHEVIGEFGGGRVMLRPASPGTGIIAGGGVRAVVEAAGIKDVLAKSLGSKNPFNVVKATLDALEQLRTREQIYAARGKRTREKAAL
jgi:small subunit ribosomal protein S5